MSADQRLNDNKNGSHQVRLGSPRSYQRAVQKNRLVRDRHITNRDSLSLSSRHSAVFDLLCLFSKPRYFIKLLIWTFPRLQLSLFNFLLDSGTTNTIYNNNNSNFTWETFWMQDFYCNRVFLHKIWVLFHLCLISNSSINTLSKFATVCFYSTLL